MTLRNLNPKRRKTAYLSGFSRKNGRSDRIRTCGILVPNQARYQLRYTPIFSFAFVSRQFPNQARYQLRYTRIYTFSVSGNLTVYGQSCGQRRFRGNIYPAGKSRKGPRCKGFRRFSFTRLGYRHGTPKPSALPTALHPDIQFCLRFAPVPKNLYGPASPQRPSENYTITGKNLQPLFIDVSACLCYHRPWSVILLENAKKTQPRSPHGTMRPDS